MEFFETVEKRRSIRRFTPQPIPIEFVEKALKAALLAPNSSNAQTWDFYWVQSAEAKAKLVEACFGQSAARTASQLVVVTADPKNWKRAHKPLVDFVESVKAPAAVLTYYKKLLPFMYTWGPLSTIGYGKKLLGALVGPFKVFPRGPNTRQEVQEVCVKSAALAAENFVLAITAQGAATCMMEGFDEVRVKKILKARGTTKVVMVIGIGYEAEKGTWGPRFRIPQDQTIHII